VPQEKLQKAIAQPADAVVKNKVLTALGVRRGLRW
jgi:hypothetical protein